MTERRVVGATADGATADGATADGATASGATGEGMVAENPSVLLTLEGGVIDLKGTIRLARRHLQMVSDEAAWPLYAQNNAETLAGLTLKLAQHLTSQEARIVNLLAEVEDLKAELRGLMKSAQEGEAASRGERKTLVSGGG